MQTIISTTPDDRKYWRDFSYHFYTLKNPKYRDAMRDSAKVRQEAREVYGRKYENVTSTISLIGDPLEKARADATVNAGPPAVPAGALRVPLVEPKVEAGVQKVLDIFYEQFLKIVKEYRTKTEKNINASSLTATYKKDTLYLNHQEIFLVHDPKFPREFYIDVGENPIAGRRFADMNVFYLFAAEDVENAINVHKIDRNTIIDYAVLMERLGILPNASKNNPKAMYLRAVLNTDEGKKALVSANKDKGKGKATSSTGAGFGAINYYKGPDELVDRLILLIESINAGNNSLAVRNEGMSLLNKLSESKAISKSDFNNLMKYFL